MEYMLPIWIFDYTYLFLYCDSFLKIVQSCDHVLIVTILVLQTHFSLVPADKIIINHRFKLFPL